MQRGASIRFYITFGDKNEETRQNMHDIDETTVDHIHAQGTLGRDSLCFDILN